MDQSGKIMFLGVLNNVHNNINLKNRLPMTKIMCLCIRWLRGQASIELCIWISSENKKVRKTAWAYSYRAQVETFL